MDNIICSWLNILLILFFCKIRLYAPFITWSKITCSFFFTILRYNSREGFVVTIVANNNVPIIPNYRLQVNKYMKF